VSTPAIRWFATPADFFEAMFGPTQHDAHVKTRHQRMHLEGTLAAYTAANAGLEEWMAGDWAKRSGFNTAVLRSRLHSLAAGGASDKASATGIRIARRALDIAIEHHGAMAVAAE
jgi:hypothetical protein